MNMICKNCKFYHRSFCSNPKRFKFTLAKFICFKKQKTFVYCPKCNNELVRNGNLIKDTDFVYYRCSKCGHESKWDFDAPCPILVEGDK